MILVYVTLGLLQPLKKAGSDMGSLWYDRNKLARSPIGGSLVIFTPANRLKDKEIVMNIQFNSVWEARRADK